MVDRACRRCETSFSTSRGAQFYCDPCRSRCAVDGCATKPHSKGYCILHYDRLVTRGDAGGVGRERNWQSGPCSVDGCERQARKKSLCALHYKRVTLSGEAGPAGVLTKPRGVPCEVEGCARLADAAGLCNMHYCRLLKDGDVGEAHARRRANGEGCITPDGYKLIGVDGESIFEHRHVMSNVLGRPLTDVERVHHKDGDRLNNEPDNLELWVIQQPSGQRVVDLVAAAIKLLRQYPDLLSDVGLKLTTLENHQVGRVASEHKSFGEMNGFLGFGA